jgi:hypothetical protein
VARDFGHSCGMTESDEGLSTDEPVESGALEDGEDEDEEMPRGPGGEEPPSAGGLQEEQQGKGYGAR